jgi:hypothetical protein
MLSGRVMYLITHNGIYFRYNMIKKIARMLLLKCHLIGDNVALSLYLTIFQKSVNFTFFNPDPHSGTDFYSRQIHSTDQLINMTTTAPEPAPHLFHTQKPVT